MTVLYGPVIMTWAALAAVHYWHLLSAPHALDNDFAMELISIGIYALGLAFFACWVTWVMTGESVLTVGPQEMTIQRRVLGIEFDTRRYRCEDVHRLRYVAPTGFWIFSAYKDPCTSGIQFRIGPATRILAKGITEEEGNALITEMLKVYKFANTLAPGFLNELEWAPIAQFGIPGGRPVDRFRGV